VVDVERQLMLSDEEWRHLISKGVEVRRPPVHAIEYRKNADARSFATPPMLACDDGEEYWVKHRIASQGCAPTARNNQIGGMVIDHVIGMLAPNVVDEVVPSVRLVSIPLELIAAAPQLHDACPGLAHGSRNAGKNCTGRSGITDFGHYRLPINRPRIAGLAVLYGLAHAKDHQVIYSLDADPLVYSVDHGHFLPDGPNWTAVVCSGQHVGALDSQIINQCEVVTDELAAPLERLSALTASDVARAVAAPPDAWHFPESDRFALARFLWARRETILAAVA
jgi:hypothetical protein